jgi:hypothetical protein
LHHVNDTKVIIKMRISEKLKEKRTTPYQEIGQKFGVTPRYVGMIARGQRVPKRESGKAAKILRELEKICNKTNN